MSTAELFKKIPWGLCPMMDWIKTYGVEIHEVSGPARERMGRWVAEHGNQQAFSATPSEALEKLAKELWAVKAIKPWTDELL